MNRFFTTITTERERTQHLEKCVMTCRDTNVLEIVVFATGTYTELGGSGAYKMTTNPISITNWDKW